MRRNEVKMKILIVEDDRALNNGIALSLQGEEILQAFSIAQARRMFDESIDLIILDINLPDGSGLDYCREVRQGSKTAIIFLTANDMEIDIVTGLEMGADDYITKPFNILEVKARIKAIMRRNARKSGKGGKQENRMITAGDLKLDQEGRRVFIGEREINLTAKEFDLLDLFVSNPNKVYSRETLLSLVWGNKATDSGDVRTVDVHVRRLREKVEPSPSDPKYVHTKWGVGYYFRA